MQPIILTISGWGPYKEQVIIDFNCFERRGLFLITGPTGAGKTTIFDAISFALFGEVNGQTRTKEELRSDFAGGDTKTFVELRMCHKGAEYLIIRNPKYLRKKKRKTGGSEYTEEKEKAYLTMPDGTKIEGNNEVTAKMQQILSMDARQYKQISMIAQGEFAKLLEATPKEKTQIFREIFDTGIYDKFAGILHAHALDKYKEIQELLHKMEEDVNHVHIEDDTFNQYLGRETYPYDTILEFLTKYGIDLSSQHKKTIELYGKKEKEIENLAEKVTRAQQVNKLIEALHQIETENEMLKSQKESMEIKRLQLKKAEQCLEVVPYLNAMEQNIDRLTRHIKKVEQLNTDICEVDKKLLEKQSIYDQRDAIELLLASLSQYLNVAGEWKTETVKLAEMNAELGKWQAEYLIDERQVQGALNEYNQADEIYKHGAIGIVVKLVEEGKPCPVCGSLSHPNLAKRADKLPSEDTLKKLQDDYQKKQKALTETFGKTKALNGEVDALKRSIIVKKNRMDKLVLTMKEESKEAFNWLLIQIGESFEDFLEKSLEVQNKRNIQIASEFRSVMTQYANLLVTKREKAALLLQSKDEQIVLQTEKDNASKTLEEKLTKLGFTSAEELNENQLKESQRELLRRELEQYDRSASTIDGKVFQAKLAVKGKKQVDMTEMSCQLSELQNEKNDLFRKQNLETIQQSDVHKAVHSLKERCMKLTGLKEEFGVIKDLDNLACGNNGKRLVFEQYVLAGYFEDILQAANRRFLNITGGRYELKRTEEVNDGRVKDNMEILIMDYYTGKCRSAKTLSGGESFKASLCLALGMSDVIQEESGGTSLEALFIDEGFGTLDEESLDQACTILNNLAGTDKMIGIISHVPELKERINSQVVVHRGTNGSTVTVIS